MGPRRADLWIALAGGVIGAAGLGSPTAWQAVLGGLLGAALGLARFAPTACWVVAVVVFAVGALTGTLPGGDSFAAYLLVAAHGFTAGRFDGPRMGLLGIVALAAASTACAVSSDDAFAVFLFIPAAGWGAGRALRERSLVAAQLATRVRELEAEREAYAALSVRYERARIASELHDIVAHAISVMVVQASAGQRLAPHDPEATAEVFDVIADAARQAERELGLLVDLLAAEPAAAGATDLALVQELVARASSSGLDVTLALEGERDGLAPDIAQVAYRVVQEGLTNALRYAAGAAVTVRLGGQSDALVVAVANGPVRGEPSLAGVGTGNGLRGLHERVEAIGGSLDARPDGMGGWLLEARLPRIPGRPVARRTLVARERPTDPPGR